MSEDLHVLMYLDVLGYEDAIKNDNQEDLAALRSIVEKFAANKVSYLEEPIPTEIASYGNVTAYSYRPAISSFSDHVVVSAPLILGQTKGNKRHITAILFFMIRILQKFAYDALSKGFLIRGGISLGPLVHDEHIVFGKALVNAVRIEESVSFYPRVVVCNEIIELLREIPVNNIEDWDLKQCRDGLFFLDWAGSEFFATIIEDSNIKDTKDCILNAQNKFGDLIDLIQERLSKLDDNSRAQAKWVWMLNYMESATGKLKEKWKLKLASLETKSVA